MLGSSSASVAAVTSTTIDPHRPHDGSAGVFAANLDSGDRDSVGLFQQRPSQGWGEPHKLTDPVYAAKAFYGINPEVENPGLNQIEGWDAMSPTEAAQSVQRSALPDAYGQWESLADDLLGSQADVEALD